VVTHHNTPTTEDLHAHTFGRNHNSCSVSFAGFYNATSNDLGDDCATPDMIHAYVDAITHICLGQDIPVGNFMTHAEAGDNIDQGPNPPHDTPGLSGADAAPYGPLSTWERWDLHVRIDPATLHLHPIGSTTAGEYFPDWIRGQVILNIQNATRNYWKGT
jgi:hypothetical protein